MINPLMYTVLCSAVSMTRRCCFVCCWTPVLTSMLGTWRAGLHSMLLPRAVESHSARLYVNGSSPDYGVPEKN